VAAEVCSEELEEAKDCSGELGTAPRSRRRPRTAPRSRLLQSVLERGTKNRRQCTVKVSPAFNIGKKQDMMVLPKELQRVQLPQVKGNQPIIHSSLITVARLE